MIAEAASGAALWLAAAASGVSAETWTLERVLQVASASDPGIRAARMAAAAARADGNRALSDLSPRVRLDASAVRSDDPALLFSQRLWQGRFTEEDFAVGRLNDPGTRTSLEWGLTLEQPIWNGGAELSAPSLRGHRRRAADALEQARVADRLLSIVEVYVDAVRSRQAFRADSVGEASAREHRRAAAARFARGQVPELDTLRATARWAEARVALLDRGRERDIALLRLGQIVKTSVESDELPDAVVPPVLSEERLKPSLADHSELRAAKEGAATLRIESRRAGLSLLPSLSSRLSLRHYRPESTGPEERRWTGALILDLPLWDGASRHQSWRAARSRARQAEAEAEMVSRALSVRLEDARRAMAIAAERAAAARAARAAQEEALRLASRRYAEGLLSLTDLLATDADATHARRAETDAEAQIAMSRYRFLHAQGALR